MNPQRLIPLVIVVVGAAAMLYFWMQNQPAEAQEVPTRQVFFAKQNVDKGTVLDENNIEMLFDLRAIPENQVLVDQDGNTIHVTAEQQADFLQPGRFLKRDLTAQDLVAKATISNPGEQPTASRDIRKGYRIVTVPAGVDMTFDGMLSPDDVVDIMLVSSLGDEEVIMPAIQKATVFARGDQRQVNTAEGGNNRANTLTFELLPDDATSLQALLSRDVRLRLQLRNPEDEEIREDVQAIGLTAVLERLGYKNLEQLQDRMDEVPTDNVSTMSGGIAALIDTLSQMDMRTAGPVTQAPVAVANNDEPQQPARPAREPEPKTVFAAAIVKRFDGETVKQWEIREDGTVGTEQVMVRQLVKPNDDLGRSGTGGGFGPGLFPSGGGSTMPEPAVNP